MIDHQAETESNPAFEVHLGESFYTNMNEPLKVSQPARYVIIWLNGKRWEGLIYENTVRDEDVIRESHGEGRSLELQGQRGSRGADQGDAEVPG
jgi:hypothetical protein